MLLTRLKIDQKGTEFTGNGLQLKEAELGAMQNHYSAKTRVEVISKTIPQLSVLDFPPEAPKPATEDYLKSTMGYSKAVTSNDCFVQ